jgi:acylphosphatase
MKTLRLVIAGRVQGVGYRDWMVAEADRHGVTGWVRNRPDGTVEAVVHGGAAAVDALLAACRQGPRLAAVREIGESAAEPPGHTGFRRFPTA